MTARVKTPSRNEPCPCGSGRKYKHCCLGRTPQGPGATRASVAARIAEAEAFERAGQTQQAATVFASLLTDAPDSVAVLKATALHCYRQGDRGNAGVLLRRAYALDASDAELANLLGALLIELRQFEEAIVCLYRAIAQNPQLIDARANLGYALFSYGKDAEAEAALRQALAIAPDHAGTLLNLATVLRNVGRFDEAMAYLRAVLVKDESNLAAWHNLAQTLQDLGRFADSRRCYEEAARLAPGSAVVQCNLGVVVKELGEHEASLACFERALVLDPTLAEAHLRIGMIRKEQGRLEEALACFSRALASRPDFHAAHSNILFTTAFMDNLPQRRILELHREWASLQTAQVKPPLPHPNAPLPGKPLRIGYVSPDFRQHACAAFLEPLLRHHDRTQVRVYAYAGVPNPDQKTAELRALVDEWRSTVGVDDEGMVKMIREDGIDVLVDLAGHTANNRLLALAAQPAPVQVTYLGYPATTGLPAMAWRLTDAVTEPPGTGDEFYTERLYRLPHSLWCYQPFADMGPVSDSPAAANGFLTFGSFNSYSKIGPRVIELWARVLVAIPDARLVLITVPAGPTREALWARFEALGVARDRVELRGRLSRADYVATFARVDVALDPFPCNGGTTTCDALWMGLPVIALRGERFLSRASLSVLTAAGSAEFAAADEQEYVARCVALAADLPGLATVRAGLRARLASSPLTDAVGFTRDVEAAYRQMWADWCAQGVAT